VLYSVSFISGIYIFLFDNFQKKTKGNNKKDKSTRSKKLQVCMNAFVNHFFHFLFTSITVHNEVVILFLMRNLNERKHIRSQ